MKRVLIINLGGIGDFLLSTPAVRALCRHVIAQDQEAEIVLLATPKICAVAERLLYIHRVVPFALGYGGAWQLAKTWANIVTLLRLRNQHFDLAINMRTLRTEQSAKKIQLLLNVINAATTAGRDTDGRGGFFDIRVPETTIGQQYEMEYDIDTVEALGVRVTDRTIHLPIQEQDFDPLKDLLKFGPDTDKELLIGLHPGGMPSRQWPIELFAQLLQELSKIRNCCFVATGSREEAALIDRLQTMTGFPIINSAGKLNIYETAALIQSCQLFISNDTGPMHMAAILRTPLVAILGPGDLIRFDPRKISPQARVLYKGAHCAPCERVNCQDQQCLKAISVPAVVAACQELLQEQEK